MVLNLSMKDKINYNNIFQLKPIFLSSKLPPVWYKEITTL